MGRAFAMTMEEIRANFNAPGRPGVNYTFATAEEEQAYLDNLNARGIVTVYVVTITKAPKMAEQGKNYSFEPWVSPTFDGMVDEREYAGFDDGGRQYHIPDGYKMGFWRHADGSMSLTAFDPNGNQAGFVWGPYTGPPKLDQRTSDPAEVKYVEMREV